MRNFFWKNNPKLEKEVNSFFSEIELLNKREFNGEISMLLLGSMSRGEASWQTIDGIDTILSDIEVLTLLPANFSQIDKLEKNLYEIENKCFPEQKSSLFHIDYSFSRNGYDLSTLEKKLLTFDAYVYAYTVVGEDYKDTLPQVTIKNINLVDVWEIMIHRMFSVLYWGKPLKDSGRQDEYCYNLAKNSLDLMTVLLVNHGLLISGFANRLRAIKALDISDDIKNYFEYCLSIKFSYHSEFDYSIEEMENIFLRIIQEQNRLFKFHASNFYHNYFSIARRHLGQAKRAFRVKHVPLTQEKLLKKMQVLFLANKKLSNKELLDNYVLNGYPAILKK